MKVRQHGARTIFLVCFVLILSASALGHAQGIPPAAALRLIPTPQQVEMREGRFRFSSQTFIALGKANDKEDRFAADELAREVRRCFEVTPKIGGIPDEAHVLTVGTNRSEAVDPLLSESGVCIDDHVGDEGYVLRVERQRIVVEAKAAAGFFYGIQTLKQLIRGNAVERAIPCCEIVDYPALEVRGWQDDISRGPIPTMEWLKHEIRTMSEFKLNMFTLYTEHVFRLNKHPEIAPADGITADEIKTLSAYARQHHVDLVGNFQSFAHCQNILKIPEYAHLGEMGSVLTPAKEETYTFLADVFSEIAPAYESPHFIINCDETMWLGQGASKAMVDEMGIAGVYAYHISRIARILERFRKTPMMWTDIALQHPEIIPQLPRNLTMLSWGYEALPSFDGHIAPFTDLGFDLLVCPGVSCWNRVWPDFQKAVTNISNFVRDGARHGALGMLNTTWDDDGENLFGYNWYPLIWGAECAWNPATAAEGADPDTVRQTREEAFTEAFNRLFHGLTDDTAVAQSLRRLSGLRKYSIAAGLVDSAFWKTGWESVSQERMTEAQQLEEEADAIIKQLEKTRQSVRFNAHALDCAVFAARRARFLARRTIVAAGLLADNVTSESVVHVRDLAKEVRSLSRVYATLWKRENRSWWLDQNAQKYRDLADSLDRLARGKPLIITPADCVLRGSVDVQILSFGGHDNIRYTIDGSEPTPASRHYCRPITLTTPALVRARVLLPDGELGPTISKSYCVQTTYGTFHSNLKHEEGHEPERVLDGVETSYFRSSDPVKAWDYFAFVLDKPAELGTVTVHTGHPDHPDDFLHDGILLVLGAKPEQVETIAEFQNGVAAGVVSGGMQVKGVVIYARQSQQHGLVIRDIVLADRAGDQ